MNDSSDLTRAERLKLWQALKNAKKQKQDNNQPSLAKDNQRKSTSSSASSILVKKEKRRKYINKLTPCDAPDKYRSDSLSNISVGENSDPNNDFEKAAASLHQKFRDIRLSDEYENDIMRRDSCQQTGRRSSILDGYHTADDGTATQKASLPISSATSVECNIISALHAKLDCADAENSKLKLKVADANSVKREAVERLQMCVEETQALAFHNDILTKRVEDLESSQSRDRMNSHEFESNKSQKHKREIKMLKEKNLEYESRANAMVAEMAEQMAQLQDMAMKRIDQLENELMEEKHRSQTLEEALSKLQAQEKAREAAIYRRRCRRAVSVCSIDESVDENSDGTVGMDDEEDEDSMSEGLLSP